ncbi:MAG: Flagellar FliJ protein [Thermotogaceae bacterium]|jgi:flagellar FliJ protein|nr:Flagellar FliJ protein [Thermotogaceae bacterium]
MKRFNFRLQRLLNLKNSLEERKKTEINRTLAEINSINEEINGKEKQIEQELFKLSRMLSDIDVRMILDWHSYLSKLDDEKKEFEQKKYEKEQELQSKIKEYLQLSKEKKILVNLRERKFAEYLNEIDKIERTYMDEQAIMRFRNGGQENG